MTGRTQKYNVNNLKESMRIWSKKIKKKAFKCVIKLMI